MKKANNFELARKVLRLPDLKDKVICFISDWEHSKIFPYMIIEDDEKEYGFQESALFETARNWMQKDSDLGFITFREFEDNDNYEDIDFNEIEKVKKDYPVPAPLKKDFLSEIDHFSTLSRYMTKKSLAYFQLQQKERDLVGEHISILPTSVGYDYLKYLKEAGTLVDSHKLNILCIDYKEFPYFVLTHFLRYTEAAGKKEKIKVSDGLKPLYNLFRLTSIDAKSTTKYNIGLYIEKAFNNKLQIKDWDKIEFLSINHIQNIVLPSFWQEIKKTGYMCQENIGKPKTSLSESSEDVRFFYSFESLLFYELRNCLKRIKRCAFCSAVINIENSKKYKGRYCPPGSENYAICFAERNRKRQKKHYNLTKI